MKTGSDRLTFRNVSPELKRAIKLHAENKGVSMERAVINILSQRLHAELETIQRIDEMVEQAQLTH